jgi:proteasome beta subunit
VNSVIQPPPKYVDRSDPTEAVSVIENRRVGAARAAEQYGLFSSGTTTIGLRCRDGIVLATERRATSGHMIANKMTIKLFRIDHHLGMTLAGSLGDAQAVVRFVQAEAAIYRARVGRPISVEAATTFTSNLLSANRYSPYFGWFILGGVDSTGPRLFSLEAAGGSLEERYVSIGSGSPFALGVLENSWKSGTNVTDGVDLAIRGLTVAMQRDSASGDGYAVATVTDRGFVELGPDEIDRRRSKL